ncbi:membrane-spanning 4-domains subfamily A member 12-like [Tenrec ecaudatus]|uniref:membrane-spanning 4-domains subfamily A member 12-like n=1 Tax=Tenrec ecaudatus TaxID=94439 RepID=UPI003F5A9C0F
MQGSQAPFFAPPTVYANFHQGQANIQLVKPPVETGASNFKQEAKVLGGIEILIGVMHLGFGIVLGLMYGSYATVWGFTSISFIGGYTIWGGISFIISGSLSISASKVFSPCLIKGSLGMNIVSAIFAIVGMILLVVDVSINGVYYQDYWAVIAGKGISAMLMIFTLLEFSIACTLAHFATQAIPSTNMLCGPVVNACHWTVEERFFKFIEVLGPFGCRMKAPTLL